MKNDHASCNDNLLVENSEIHERVELKNVSSTEMITFRENMKSVLQEMHAYMSQKYKKFSADSLTNLASETLTLKQITDGDTLKGLKEHCHIVPDKEGKIVISQKINPSSPSINDDIRRYKEEIRGLIDDFNKKLGDVYFNTGNSMSLGDFEWHNRLSLALIFLYFGFKNLLF